MSQVNYALRPGDLVFHPQYGFGTLHSITRRERIANAAKPASDDTEADGTEEYYEINLDQGGRLMVPVRRATSVGLRRLTFGVEATKMRLCSPAEALPDNFRERADVLRLRGQRAEPTAFIHAVRDMLAQSRGRTLSAGEETWLNKSCQRLSTEAALVDQISFLDAESAIQAVMRELSAA